MKMEPPPRLFSHQAGKFYELRPHGSPRSSRTSMAGVLHRKVHFRARKVASPADRVYWAYSAHRVYTWSILRVERSRIGFRNEGMSRYGASADHFGAQDVP